MADSDSEERISGVASLVEPQRRAGDRFVTGDARQRTAKVR